MLTAELQRHRGEFARRIRNRQYERTPTGIFFPKARAFIGGAMEHTLNGRDLQIDPNIIPTQGLNHILDVVAHGTTAVNPWYVGLFEANVTPGASLTGATFDSVCTEFTDYDEATRVAYVEAAASGGVISNSASRAVFTVNASATVYGGALLSASAKNAAGGSDVCLAAVKFASSRAVVSTDELAVRYTLTLTSS